VHEAKTKEFGNVFAQVDFSTTKPLASSFPGLISWPARKVTSAQLSSLFPLENLAIEIVAWGAVKKEPGGLDGTGGRTPLSRKPTSPRTPSTTMKMPTTAAPIFLA
jgi:hypothetical protein